MPVSRPWARETNLKPVGIHTALVPSILDVQIGESARLFGSSLMSNTSTFISTSVWLAKFIADLLLRRLICNTFIMRCLYQRRHCLAAHQAGSKALTEETGPLTRHATLPSTQFCSKWCFLPQLPDISFRGQTRDIYNTWRAEGSSAWPSRPSTPPSPYREHEEVEQTCSPWRLECPYVWTTIWWEWQVRRLAWSKGLE